VLGPLATYAEPHCYDLCQMHAERLTAPLGWEIVRITPDPDALKPSSDDLEALANAVREAARPRYAPNQPEESHAGSVEVARKGHLRVLQSAPEAPNPFTDARPDAFADELEDVFDDGLDDEAFDDAPFEPVGERRPAPRPYDEDGRPGMREPLTREPFYEDDLPFDE
jgi:hypothetical protein